jgi:DNA repair exonuclease SbcCD ATPase subunit
MNIAQLEEKSEQLQNSLANLEGQEELLSQQIEDNKSKLLELSHKREIYSKSVEIFVLIQQVTQQQVKDGFDKLVTYALNYIFEQPYKFELYFEKRGNLTECNFKLFDPKGVEITEFFDGLGGGVLDIISIALRIVLLELHKPKIDSFICLDEPTRNVSAQFLPKCAQFFKEINRKIKRQMIIVTHQEILMEHADTQIKIGE